MLTRAGLPGKLSTGQVFQFLATKIPHLPSPPISFIINLCKVFRKQSWSDSQTESLKHCGIACPWEQSKTSWTLLQQPPCTTDCSTRCVLLIIWDTTQKGSWAILAAAGKIVSAVSSRVCVSVRHLLAETVILL